MTLVAISPVWVGQRFTDNNGNVLANGTITSYQGGQFTNQQTTWSDAAGAVPNSNPIVLDANGFIPTQMFLQIGLTYNFILRDANNNEIASLEDITAASAATVTNAPGGAPNSLQYNNSSASFGGLSFGAVGFILEGQGSGVLPVWTSIADFTTGVSSFNSRTGAVILTSGDVITALGYTPLSVAVSSFNSRTGAVTLTSGDVTSALGFTPGAGSVISVSAATSTLSISGSPITSSGVLTIDLPVTAVSAGSYTNANITVDQYGRLTSAANGSAGGVSSFNTRVGAVTLTSGDVTTALGFTPISSAVLSFNTRTGAVTLTSGDVTSALGFTPLAANQAITLSGDATGTGTTAITVVLANTTVTPGSYTSANITIDSKGRITAAGNGSGGGGGGTVTSVGASSSNLTIGGVNPVTSSGTITIDLPTTAVTAGSYTYSSFTVDAFGRVTAASSGTPVTSFNTRTGAVTLTAGDVNGALGYVAYSSLNPAGYLSTAVTSLTGTANEVIVSSSTGAVTLSTPQPIGTSSTPTFAGATLAGAVIGAPTAYGSLAISGSNTSYAGIQFTGTAHNATLMISTAASGIIQGFYNQGTSAWMHYWTDGTLTVGTVPVANVSGISGGTGISYSGGVITNTLPGVVYTGGTGVTVSGGTISIGQAVTTASAVTFGNITCNGAITATGNITGSFSDDRLKTRFSNITDALEKVESLNGFYYVPNKLAQSMGYTAEMDVGVSAQEVSAVLIEATADAPINSEYMTVRYEKLVPLLIEAIKELSAKVKKLEGR